MSTGLAIVNSSDSGGTGFQVNIGALHNGATLQNLQIFFSVGASHASIAGMNFPSMAIVRVPLGPVLGSAPTDQPLSTSPNQSASNPGTGAAWYNLGKMQQFQYVCNQNNVIDTSNYYYVLAVSDENGANAHFGNVYYGMNLAYAGITDARFP